MTIFSDGAMISLLNRSLTGGVVILLVLCLRLILKNMPKKYLCILWLIPFARLLFSISVEAPVSLLPIDPEPVVEAADKTEGAVYLNTGVEFIDEAVNRQLLWDPGTAAFALENNSSKGVYPFRSLLNGFGMVWVTGAVLLLGVHLFRYFRLRRQLSWAIPSEERAVYYSDRISMPMILGAVRPKIYLPVYFCEEERKAERDLILAHEYAHKTRRDYLIKPILFAGLVLHWFNPLVWAAAFALVLIGAAAVTLLTDPVAGDPEVVSVIGGADGPTSIFLAGKLAGGPSDDTAVIGGADGPTSIFLAGKLDGGLSGDVAGTQGEAAVLDVDAAKGQPYGMTVELDLVSMDKISFHGSFGYLSFNLKRSGQEGTRAQLAKAFTLEEAGPIIMQGDSYTEVLGGDGTALVVSNAYAPSGDMSLTWYFEETGEYFSIEEDVLQGFRDSIEQGGLRDARLDGDQLIPLAERVQKEYGSRLLYGPAGILEFDSRVYGFLAADGENLEDIWYGIWYANEAAAAEPLVRIELFP